MHAIIQWLYAGAPPHYVSMFGVAAYLFLEWELPRMKSVSANSTVELLANAAKRLLLDRIPILGRLVAFLATPTPVPAIAPADSKLPMLIGFLIAGMSLHGCACFGAQAQNTPQCVVVHQLIDCTEGTATSAVLPVVEGLVAQFISGGGQMSVDWGSLFAQLGEKAGFKEASCMIAALEKDYGDKAPGLHMAAQYWYAAHGLKDVHFKLTKAG